MYKMHLTIESKSGHVSEQAYFAPTRKALQQMQIDNQAYWDATFAAVVCTVEKMQKLEGQPGVWF